MFIKSLQRLALSGFRPTNLWRCGIETRFFAMALVLSCSGAGLLASEASGDAVQPRKSYEIWEREPAPNRGHDFSKPTNGRGYPFDEDWQRWSYPLGNGNLGANVFGRTDVERIQLTEKTIANGSAYGRGGVTNAAELLLDFGHGDIRNYRRALNLDDAMATVSYESGGTTFRREVFASYRDDVLVIRLTADRPGALTFKVRPEIPYLESKNELDRKTGTVTAKGDTITLAGTMEYYQINYELQVKVLNEGGTLTAEGATIEVKDADAVTLLVAAGTNYKLSPELFLKEPKEKLDPKADPHQAVTAKIRQAAELGFTALKDRHLEDYRNLFGRVQVNLNSKTSELPTSELLKAYQEGKQDTYLEELIFQYGRYLLIASSRENTLPAHLQGAWSQFEVSPWCGGYWHNINVQMNYWGAMNTDLAETFKPYIDYYNAYHPLAQRFADDFVRELRPEKLSTEPGGNGWIIGTAANAYQISGRSTHSGPGTGAFTAQMFMDYYDFTQDKEFLRETGYPALLGMSRFFDKALHESKDGKLLIRPSASPEIKHNNEFYITEGCTFDQGFVWENHNNVLRAAAALGEEDPFLEVIKAQIPRLDPILVGSSGQIKEFREEDAYGDIGDPKHRHISHLCPLYPGTLINSLQPEWMQAASKTLDLRGDDDTSAWAMAHRMNCRARLKEGDKAHAVFSKFIKVKTMPNLWANHPPFQIDGNFGVMSGVAEMLLQSHEGYIEPLPALPEAWKDGSFDGLVARGNFKVSADWKNGDITQLAIESRSGGPARLKFPNAAQATVTGAEGKPVPTTSDTPDLISFPTEKGRSYSIHPQNAPAPSI
jgi:alpha-L-fucosidase 2